MSETYFWVAALLDQVLNLDLRPNFKIARVLRVPSPKIFDTVPPPDHSRVSGSLLDPSTHGAAAPSALRRMRLFSVSLVCAAGPGPGSRRRRGPSLHAGGA